MAYLLGIDTGGTYTDAVILDEPTDQVMATAKALTSRPDLAQGVGAAMDAVLQGVAAQDVALVALSTTLATNALVEGQGGRIALVFIGFTEADLDRAGLKDALRGDPVIVMTGGHGHSGAEVTPLDLEALRTEIAALDAGITGFAIASSFATRNAAHEIAARDLIRDMTGKPVTCSHELSSALGGPKRALTAGLNARLIGMIDRLITACENHMEARGITARVVGGRGDGARVALISDIGGTTTDICLLRDGKPQIDPQGAQVGPYRTMVEAVAMRTSGLGGDSEVHLREGLDAGLFLGPRRVMPMALAAQMYPQMVHDALDQALSKATPAVDGGQIVIPLWEATPEGVDPREAAIVARLADGPKRYGHVVTTRMEAPALARLVAQGLVILAGVTPSDAAHVLGRADAWDDTAAEKALALFARRRTGGGERLAPDAGTLAQMIIDQLTAQTVDCLLIAAFAEDSRAWDMPPDQLAKHPLTRAGLDNHTGVIATSLKLGLPVIGLGASAASYYGAVGTRLQTQMILPKHADVANAIGAVVGQVAMHARGTITSGGAEQYNVHVGETPMVFHTQDAALSALEAALQTDAAAQAKAAGVDDIRITVDRDIKTATIEGQTVFIEATMQVTAQGRPRIALT